jgi:hypothetical protein
VYRKEERRTTQMGLVKMATPSPTRSPSKSTTENEFKRNKTALLYYQLKLRKEQARHLIMLMRK